MKKSCSAKESKVVTTKDAKNVLNVSKDSKEHLTEEQILINKKLVESGIEDEGLGWLEKTNIFKTIIVSLDIAGSERLQRSSPRFAKATNSKAAKWIENSFDKTKNDESNNEKVPKSNKRDSENPPTSKAVPILSNKKPNQESEESELKSIHKPKPLNSQKDAEVTDFPKPSKKVNYIKINVEENSKKECSLLPEGDGQGLSLGKKRASQPEVNTLEASKKLKMDEANNGVSSEEETPLQVELEMENRKRSEPIKIRDIQTIVAECEIRNTKWKETFLKYKCPTRWGMPIVRNCSEKWDGNQIPPKLLHRYQKYLSSHDLTHPVFLPVKLQNNVHMSKVGSEIGFESGAGTNSECRDESENDVKDSGDGTPHDESNITSLENNLNASHSARNTGERMVLRNRSQQKTVISDEEEFSSDDSDDWLVKQKSTKKQKFNAKNKKPADQSNKQLVMKLERCNINRGNGQEGSRKNGNKNDAGLTGGSMMSSDSLNQAIGNSKSGPDPDTMVCPICSLRFKKQYIEGHATECASKTYKD